MSYSEVVMNEMFGFGKKKRVPVTRAKKKERKYGLLTEQEFNKCMSIIKSAVNKYNVLEETSIYDKEGIYSTYSKYKNFCESCGEDYCCVVMFEWSYICDDEDKMAKYNKQLQSAEDSIKKSFEKLPFKVELDETADDEWDIFRINSRKPLESSTNESAIDESAGGTVLKGIGSAVKSIGAGAFKLAIGYIVVLVVLAGIICAVGKSKKKKIDNYLASNPQVKKAANDAREKVSELFKKGITDDAFYTDNPDQIKADGFKVNKNTDAVTYSAAVGEYWITEIDPDDRIDDDLQDPDWGYSFKLDSPEKKAFAKKLKDRYSAFKSSVDAITKEIHSLPNGDLINIELTPEFDDSPVFDETNGNFTAQGIVYVIMVIRFKDISSLDQTDDVVNAKKNAEKKLGKMNESAIEVEAVDEAEHVKRHFMPKPDGIKDAVSMIKSDVIDSPKLCKKYLSDLEYSYDKKYNAFCLTVSSYSVDKLESTLVKKKEELADAKEEKRAAYTIDRTSKLAAQIKIDYLTNICNKLTAMIKKKKSFDK